MRRSSRGRQMLIERGGRRAAGSGTVCASVTHPRPSLEKGQGSGAGGWGEVLTDDGKSRK